MGRFTFQRKNSSSSSSSYSSSSTTSAYPGPLQDEGLDTTAEKNKAKISNGHSCRWIFWSLVRSPHHYYTSVEIFRSYFPCLAMARTFRWKTSVSSFLWVTRIAPACTVFSSRDPLRHAHSQSLSHPNHPALWSAISSSRSYGQHCNIFKAVIFTAKLLAPHWSENFAS